MRRLILNAPPGAPFDFAVTVEGADAHDPTRILTVTAPGGSAVEHRLPAVGQNDWLDLYAALAPRFGTRLPANRRPAETPSFHAAFRPLLTKNLTPDILYGYGDPSVARHDRPDGTPEWWLVVTSNDAPNAFPLLRSTDLERWQPAGFVFPEGRTPAWALTGENMADFWAPELHRVGDEWWLCYAARDHARELAIGLAKADAPGGPFRDLGRPLVGGGVIDAHLLIGPGGEPHLLWKEDSNGVWPGPVAELLHADPALIAALFTGEEDRRTASLVVTLQPWTRTLEPMEQFFVHQPLIEAVTDDFSAFETRLAALARADSAPVLHAMRTRVFAQALLPDGSGLTGERVLVLQNDRPWEAHLIEGVWVAEHGGRWWLFYAGNDFSTDRYGVGAAVADHPLGPYRKMDEPVLRSTTEWRGPGHPSVAPGPDGRPTLFLHAYRPGEAGYKVFRALLSAPIRFEGDRVVVG
ncbi:MAG TPA: family 43 glycosylhydrolase [Caulobacteraceae bacterium]|nr:family 43 glycosylhydrolase [Caulobacteraceae bacterium]